jgi:hypothetical protein
MGYVQRIRLLTTIANSLDEKKLNLSLMSGTELYNFIKSFKGNVFGHLRITPTTEAFYVKLSKTDFLYMLKKYKNHIPDAHDADSLWNILVDEGNLYIGR